MEIIHHRNSFNPFLPPANEVCEGYVFTGVCDSVNRGRGVRGFIRGACVVLFGGACMVLFGGGMRGFIPGVRGFIQGGSVRGFIRGEGGVRGFIRGGWGGVRGFIWGACVVLFGGRGACVVLFGGGWACVVFPVFSDTMRYGQ